MQAIHHRRGPMLIIAGAGTGKTTVITERVKWLIEKKLALPGEILALTFTEKAAREMEDRIDRALPLGFTQMWVMTFHGFCDRILRDECLHVGLSPNYTLQTSVGSVALLRRHLFDAKLGLDYFRPLGNPNKFISGLLDHFNRLQDEDITPEEYEKWVSNNYPNTSTSEAQQYHELSRAFSYFQNLKHEENSMDFADVISSTLSLFRTRPHILSKYQNHFRYILVDEYQDTNYAQNQIVDLLSGKKRNLTVVADDDQSVYRWRGAAVSNVIRFRDVYPDAKLVVLTKNYRSSQAILDASYKLIRHNDPERLEIKEKIDKRLIAVSTSLKEPPEYMHFSRLESEADGVSKKIMELIKENPHFHPSDFAILVRANAHAHPFYASLLHHGLPAQFLGPARLFDQPEIKDLIALLRVIHDPTDTASFFRLLAMDFFAVPPRDLISISNFAQKQNLPLFEACENLHTSAPALSSAGLFQIKRLTALVSELLNSSIKQSAGQILFNFLQGSGVLAAMINYTHNIDIQTAQNMSTFFTKLKSFETENSDQTISAVLDWIDLAHEVGESPAAAETDWSENDAVSLLTVHSAKGLEFPVVFLVNLVVGRFPSLERHEQIPIPNDLIKEILPAGDYHLQEERRLFYVGMTRAKDRLFLTSSDYYGEGKRIRKTSPFVAEALGSAESTAIPAGEQLQLSDWQAPQFSSLVISPSKMSKVTYLSYSQIQTFNDCPLHYKAKYLLKLPSPQSAASSFGNTIHKTMKAYYQALEQNKNTDIIEMFSRNWSPEGYHNAKHAQKYFDMGCRYLSRYIITNPFISQPVILEEPFSFTLGKIKVGGKIDRADILADGTLEIIDYKTSTKPLDLKSAAKDLQLSFYALAATTLPYAPFNRKPDQVKLTLYYFHDQKAVSVFQTADQLKSAKQKILDTAIEIEKSDFKCSGSLICRGKCDYQILCDIS